MCSWRRDLRCIYKTNLQHQYSSIKCNRSVNVLDIKLTCCVNYLVYFFLCRTVYNFIKIGLFWFLSSGLTYVGGVLKHNGQSVESTTAADGLHSFIQFLSRFPHAILIWHNIQSFDIPVLLHQLDRHNLLKDFEGSVEGFIDTLKLVRNAIPKAEVGNYKQDNLV